MRLLALVSFLAVAGGLFWFAAPDSGASRDYVARVVRTLPHDREAYTQGFLFRDGHFYESTGRNGSSSVRRVEVETGRVLARHDLPARYFGEGLAFDGSEFVQLTWYAGKAFRYTEDLEPAGVYEYRGEGWGLTFDGRHLIVSDGSDRLHFVEPAGFRAVHSVRVTENGFPVRRLNELEYIDGEIWANVWKADAIVVIDPEKGVVRRRIDLSGVYDHRRNLRDPEAVPNGIAWDPDGERIYVTGKLWPHVFEIEVVEARPSR